MVNYINFRDHQGSYFYLFFRNSQKISYENFEDDEYIPTKKVKINKTQAKFAEILIEWRKDKIIPLIQQQESAKLIKSKDFSKIKFTDYAQNIQAIFINISWKSKLNKNGKTIQDLEKIKFENQALIKNGIVFIWSEKELLSKIMDIMEKKNFQYIENFVCIELSKQIALNIVNNQNKGKQSLKQLSTENSVQEDIFDLFSKVDATQIFKQDDYSYFKKTKKVLMMFRRFGKDQLELRHQRTSDAIFNLESQPGCYDEYLLEYVYNLIETLLPKAKYTKDQGFKLIQLYGNQPRQDWLTFQE